MILVWFVYSTWWGVPWTIDLFFARTWWKLALQSPETLTSVGILEAWGIRFHDSHLDAESDAHRLQVIDLVASELAVLRHYDRDRLAPAERLSADDLEWSYANIVAGRRFLLDTYPITQQEGVHIDLPSFMLAEHPLQSLSDAHRFNDRLLEFGPRFDEVRAALLARRAHGTVAPRFVIEQCLAQMRDFIAPEPRRNALYQYVAARLAALPGADARAVKDTLDDTERTLREGVYPAYRRLIATEESLLAVANQDAGVWKLQDGASYYAYRLRRATTTDVTPEEAHRLGLAEVARIEGEIREHMAALGVTGNSPGAFFKELSRRPAMHYPDNSDASKQALIADYQKVLDEAAVAFQPAFHLKPKTGLEVRAIEAFREQSAPGAYYEDGSLDGKRKGIFFVNTRNVAAEPDRFTIKDTAYHEGIPGHYWQGGIAAQQSALPLFRKFLSFNAYDEGWALYAERLAYEMHLYDNDPYGDLGRLQWELVRAVRLVVDTGLHAERWTREQAIDYMETETGDNHADVVSEVDRYIVDPGQACSYKIGQLHILALRERMQAALGPRFTLADFHDAILKDGSLPLALLDRAVDARIGALQAQTR